MHYLTQQCVDSTTVSVAVAKWTHTKYTGEQCRRHHAGSLLANAVMVYETLIDAMCPSNSWSPNSTSRHHAVLFIS